MSLLCDFIYFHNTKNDTESDPIAFQEGDLFDVIASSKKFPEDESRLMIKHLSSALAYLHNRRIVHRDIKPENLLVRLDENKKVRSVKLGDFGLAQVVTEPLYSVCGTPTYVAPEILSETGYELKVGYIHVVWVYEKENSYLFEIRTIIADLIT